MLGCSSHSIVICTEKAKEMRSTGDGFRSIDRRKRQDCIVDKARIAVFNFCHSESASYVQSNGTTKVVEDPVTGQNTKHPVRIWHRSTHKENLAAFHGSKEYADFQANNEGATIGMTRFRKLQCLCVRSSET